MTYNISISEGSRVPPDLQAVFIAASLGQEVDEPPPKAASFSYYLSWIWDSTGAFDSVSSLDSSFKTDETTSTKKPSKSSRTKSGEKKSFFGVWKSSMKQTKKSSKRIDPKTSNAPIPITVRGFVRSQVRLTCELALTLCLQSERQTETNLAPGVHLMYSPQSRVLHE